MKKILIIITGSISAYKILDLIKKIEKRNIKIYVICTNSAKNFINEKLITYISKSKIISNNLFDYDEIKHVKLIKELDLVLIAPATANIISKISIGAADDMISVVSLMIPEKTVIAPAMNTLMFKNKILQHNINKLKKIGMEFIDPEEGKLACGQIGIGKLRNIDYISEYILNKIN